MSGQAFGRPPLRTLGRRSPAGCPPLGRWPPYSARSFLRQGARSLRCPWRVAARRGGAWACFLAGRRACRCLAWTWRIWIESGRHRAAGRSGGQSDGPLGDQVEPGPNDPSSSRFGLVSVQIWPGDVGRIWPKSLQHEAASNGFNRVLPEFRQHVPRKVKSERCRQNLARCRPSPNDFIASGMPLSILGRRGRRNDDYSESFLANVADLMRLALGFQASSITHTNDRHEEAWIHKPGTTCGRKTTFEFVPCPAGLCVIAWLVERYF